MKFHDNSIIRLFDYSIISQRRGSALLIVLGMLSFMVISAVSFSIFMRQSRAPSSYLRRNIAARYLVRAALANVLEDLEGRYNTDEYWGEGDANGNPLSQNHFFGIYDDPYPGCGPDRAWAGTTDHSRDGDYWMNRVFMPFGPVQDHLQFDDPALPTVPTLTLEALAYLPPAIVDDVRKLSRLTRTACWRSLPYESGRFAYTAVNVSDLFDVNRLRASEPRDSGYNRITLASLCASGIDAPFDIDVAKAESVDRMLDKVEDAKVNGNVVPFVSLADFNFLAGQEDSSHLYTPFMNYIGTTSENLLKDRPETANALFVTDSWFPAASGASAGNLVTLDLGAVQPFRNFNATTMMATDNSLNNGQTPDGTKISDIYQKNLGPATFALYDYLDGDSQPISLAFPTTEAVPMVVGVGAPDRLRPEIVPVSDSKTAQRTIGTHKYNVERKLTKYMVKSFSQSKINVQAAVMRPFRRLAKTTRNGNYQLRGVLRIFLVPDGTDFMNRPTRPMGTGPRLDLKTAFDNQGAKTYSMGVASFTATAQQMIPFSGDTADQKSHAEWIKDVTLQFDTDNINIPIIQHVEETWTPITNDPQDPTPPVTKTPVDTLMGMGVTSDSAIWRPIANSGAPINAGDWAGAALAGQLNADISEPGTTDGPAIDNVTSYDASQSGKYQLYASVWLQVVEGSGTGAKVYDMVPACAEDDELWLGAAPANPSMLRGDGCPLLDFIADYPGFAIDTALGGVFNNDATFGNRKALFAVDPRYNHAPENWFFSNAGNTGLANNWCTALRVDDESDADTKVFGTDGRDRDVFMFVSDQEYLQSIGELQFLPALRELDGNGSMLGDNTFNAGDRMDGRAFFDGSGGITKEELKNDDTFANGWNFWRTYTAYNNGDGFDENLYKLPANGKSYRLVPGTDGFKVNPYSDDDRVLAAALAGTPFDYYVASTNDDQRQSGAKKNTLRNTITSLDKMRDYSFCEDCDLAKITDDEMTDLMGAIRDGFAAKAASGNSNWADAWDGLSWQSVNSGNCGDNNKIFLGDVILQKPLYGVDRKFLYSFWRDCFDNRQQLFLIFVRAEPVSFGGAAAASQLGGRAVALVWRDPAKPEKNASSRPDRSSLRGGGNNKSSGNMKQSHRISAPTSAYRDMKRDYPPHRTRILFFHQFD